VSLTPEGARRLHVDSIVIDTQQPPATTGFLFTDAMRAALDECHRNGMSRWEATLLMGDLAAKELATSSAARETYLEMWRRSGVTAACGTYSSWHDPGHGFEMAVRRVAQAHAVVDALGGELRLVRRAVDIEEAHRAGTHGVILDFQNTVAYADVLDRIDQFHSLGVRMVQLTYNVRNLVGDGCTEPHPGGLSRFGHEVVKRLNATRTLIDVSHCSEEVGWDALETSDAPIVISHSTSRALYDNPRAKSDALAKAVADRGGYFGVVILPAFLSGAPEPGLDDFADHIEHLVNVCGIDHVGVGTDKTGPGPSDGSMVQFPEEMRRLRPTEVNWWGVRDTGGLESKRRRDDPTIGADRLPSTFRLKGFEDFRDWPNLTVHLAERGFDEQQLRKLLGLNFLRVFRDVVG
jgi:membrane dipeptidase